MSNYSSEEVINAVYMVRDVSRRLKVETALRKQQAADIEGYFKGLTVGELQIERDLKVVLDVNANILRDYFKDYSEEDGLAQQDAFNNFFVRYVTHANYHEVCKIVGI